MSTAQVRTDSASPTVVRDIDLKFEVVVIPVLDVDRSKDFYASLGTSQPHATASLPVASRSARCSTRRHRAHSFNRTVTVVA